MKEKLVHRQTLEKKLKHIINKKDPVIILVIESNDNEMFRIPTKASLLLKSFYSNDTHKSSIIFKGELPII